MNFQNIGAKTVVATAVLTGVTLVSAPAHAFSIGETLQFSSNATVGYDLDSALPNILNFGNNEFDPNGGSGALGSFRVVGSGRPGSFAPYNGQIGTIKDLQLNPPTPTPILNFLQVADLSFELTNFTYSITETPSPFDTLTTGISGFLTNASGERVFATGSITGQIPTDPIGTTSYSGTLTVTAIPTPALLPGLIGLGVAALRKRKQEKVEAEV